MPSQPHSDGKTERRISMRVPPVDAKASSPRGHRHNIGDGESEGKRLQVVLQLPAGGQADICRVQATADDGRLDERAWV